VNEKPWTSAKIASPVIARSLAHVCVALPPARCHRCTLCQPSSSNILLLDPPPRLSSSTLFLGPPPRSSSSILFLDPPPRPSSSALFLGPPPRPSSSTLFLDSLPRPSSSTLFLDPPPRPSSPTLPQPSFSYEHNTCCPRHHRLL
jgi:hypothetical protein